MAKNIFKSLPVKVCAAAAVVLAAGLVWSTFVYAHMGGDPIEVEVTDASGADDELICINETICDGRYTVIMNGVTEADKDDLLKKIEANIDHIQTDIPVKFINNGFVDADKYSYTYAPEKKEDQYDHGQCWLASVSDMLTIGGWAQGLYNPLNNYEGNSRFISKNFEDEDDVFLYMTSNFDAYANLQENGISFFFNGLYRRYNYNGTTLTKEKTLIKNSVGAEQTGFYPDVYAKSLIKETVFADNTDSLSVLEDFESKAYGVKLDFDGNGGHAVTAVGVILDNEKSGSEKYAAIFLADSDNEDAADIDAAPESMQAAFEARKSRVNSYTMYGLEVSRLSSGKEGVLIKGYKSNLEGGVFLGAVVTLPFKSDAVMESAKETAANATKNAKDYADFIANSISVEKSDYSEGTIKEGDALTITAQIVNGSDISTLTKENSGVDSIKNKIEIIKDGEVYKVIEDGLDISTSDPGTFNEWFGATFTLNLKDLNIELPAGSYTLKLYVNTGNAKEAYVVNNTPAECSLTVEKADTPASPEKETPSSADSSSSNKNVPSSPKTGGTDWLAICMALCACAAIFGGVFAAMAEHKRGRKINERK